MIICFQMEFVWNVNILAKTIGRAMIVGIGAMLCLNMVVIAEAMEEDNAKNSYAA